MIDFIEQETLNITWFLVDQMGCIAIFSTGGGILPTFISSNFTVQTLKDLESFFDELPNISEHSNINPNLNTIPIVRYKTNYQPYLNAGLFSSQKGLYTFEHTDPCNMVDTMYFLVTSPVTPLHIDDLPLEIRQKLTIQTFQGKFEGIKEFDIKELGVDDWG